MSISINFRDIKGKNIELDVNTSDKLKLYVDTLIKSFEVENVKIIFKGTVVDIEKTFEELGFKNSDVIMIAACKKNTQQDAQQDTQQNTPQDTQQNVLSDQTRGDILGSLMRLFDVDNAIPVNLNIPGFDGFRTMRIATNTAQNTTQNTTQNTATNTAQNAAQNNARNTAQNTAPNTARNTTQNTARNTAPNTISNAISNINNVIDMISILNRALDERSINDATVPEWDTNADSNERTYNIREVHAMIMLLIPILLGSESMIQQIIDDKYTIFRLFNSQYVRGLIKKYIEGSVNGRIINNLRSNETITESIFTDPNENVSPRDVLDENSDVSNNDASSNDNDNNHDHVNNTDGADGTDGAVDEKNSDVLELCEFTGVEYSVALYAYEKFKTDKNEAANYILSQM